MDFNGIMPRAELAAFRNPSVAGLFESVVGRWGNILISIGLLISVLGAYLVWTLFAAEVPFMAAKDGIIPTFLNRKNAQKVPSVSLWMTNITVQTFLILTLFAQNAIAQDITADYTHSLGHSIDWKRDTPS